MPKHFEEVWDQCESLFKETGELAATEKSSSLTDNLIFKINLYKAVDLKNDIPDAERQKIKSRTLGEILWTLTNISMIDNINVFEALNSIYEYRSVEHFSKKY